MKDHLASHRISGQAVRFLLVGGVATVVDIGLFNVLHYAFGIGPLSSKVGSTVIAGGVAFLGNRHWSFGDQQHRGVGRQAWAFALVSVAALALGLVPLAITRYGLEMTGPVALNVSANVIGLALATAFRFYGCRRWVFETLAPVPATIVRPVPVRSTRAPELMDQAA